MLIDQAHGLVETTGLEHQCRPVHPIFEVPLWKKKKKKVSPYSIQLLRIWPLVSWHGTTLMSLFSEAGNGYLGIDTVCFL